MQHGGEGGVAPDTVVVKDAALQCVRERIRQGGKDAEFDSASNVAGLHANC
jgi:hypothetical protein